MHTVRIYTFIVGRCVRPIKSWTCVSVHSSNTSKREKERRERGAEGLQCIKDEEGGCIMHAYIVYTCCPKSRRNPSYTAVAHPVHAQPLCFYIILPIRVHTYVFIDIYIWVCVFGGHKTLCEI